MVDDLSDVWKELRALKAEVRQARTATPLENASVSNGRVRLIGGTLRVDSGGRVEIVGTLDVEGTTTLTGDTSLEGNLHVHGDGDITVAGQVPIRIGTTSAGLAGIAFGTDGAQLASIGDATILQDGEGGVIGVGGGASMVQGPNIEVGSLPDVPANSSAHYVVLADDGRLYKASPNGGGDPGNPGTPGDNPGGYIYPVDPNAWTLGDDYAAHVARGSAEPGIDWWTSIGTPIWAPGDGTITDVQTSYAGATGAYVTLVTDAGDWFRFLHLSSPNVTVGSTVSQGDVIAYSGGSGFGSPAGYGPHIHVSFAVGYTGSFPGAGGLDDLLAYMEAA